MEIEFNYISDKGTVFKRQHPFEGIIPNMERRYRETESNSVREELAKFLSISKCSSCDGTRLTESARHVLIDEKLKRKNEISKSIGNPLPLEKDLNWKAKLTVDEIINKLIENKIKDQKSY